MGYHYQTLTLTKAVNGQLLNFKNREIPSSIYGYAPLCFILLKADVSLAS